MEIFLQPIVNSNTLRIEGCETLLRWKRSDGDISPAVFIPVAESTGLINSIGKWVFEKAASLQKKIQDLYGETDIPYVSVNISQKQLNQADFISQIKSVLLRTGANPAGMLLEITESALMDDMSDRDRIMEEFGRIGLKIAIDDFGTGYSSFSELVKMPVDNLKIDKAFIDNIDTHSGAQTVASAIIKMASALDLKVIAEGVETQSQVDFLKEQGCTSIQGYFFYKPMNETMFLELINKQMFIS